MESQAVAFLLGAGFNADARACVPGCAVSYPLLGDLGKECFDYDRLPAEVSIEDLFHDAVTRHDRGPLQRLCDLLMEADFEIACRLRCSEGAALNLYLTFFQNFPGAPFLTFNYDSLPEILLLSLGRWRPEDGYGLPVEVELPPHPPPLPEQSTNRIFHLHGTLCLYPQEFMITRRPGKPLPIVELRNRPKFIFDPDAIEACFSPFQRAFPETSFRPVEDRIIAPVPDRAVGLKGTFVREIFVRSAELLAQARILVAIGYRFGSHDRAAYHRLLTAMPVGRVLLVMPDAEEHKIRLSAEYRHLTWQAMPMTFSAWVGTGFDGL